MTPSPSAARPLRLFRYRHRAAQARALLVVAAFLGAREARGEGPERPAFIARASLNLEDLAAAIDVGDPQVARASLDVALARADQRRSRLFENPSLDVGSAVAVGPLNPSTISRWDDTPQSTVGLSYRFLLGKRGPRRSRADASAAAAASSFGGIRRERALELGRVLGRLALATLRSEALDRFRREGTETLKLTEARLSSGFATPLDVDRMQVEEARLDQQRIASTAELETARADCTSLVGRPCLPFPSAEEARTFLRRWATSPAPEPSAVASRADVRALEAEARAAEAGARQAEALRIPDPTLRLGYTRDQQTFAGSQPHMLGLSLSLPLPVFDHGQADLLEANARQKAAREERDRLVLAGEARVASLRAALGAHLARQALLEKEAIPRAESVVQSLTRAASARLISLTDVIQARRALNELVMDETESMGDAFGTYLDLLAEAAPRASAAAAPQVDASSAESETTP